MTPVRDRGHGFKTEPYVIYLLIQEINRTNLAVNGLTATCPVRSKSFVKTKFYIIHYQLIKVGF